MASDTFLLSVDPRTTTPTGSPPKDFIPLNETNGNIAAAGAPRADTSQILKALADMAKTNTTAAPGMPSQASPINVPNLQNAYQQHMNSSVNPATSAAHYVQPVNVPGAAIGANPFAGLMSSASNFGLNQGMPGGQQANVQAPPVMPQGTTPEALQQQVQLIQMLQAQGVPQDQWATVLQVLMAAGTVGGGASSTPAQPSWQQNGGRDDSSRDRNGYDNSYNMRSPSGRYRSHRSRSRSPSGYSRRREPTPPRRRDSPSYGDYGRGGRSGRQERSRNEYRQRSPAAPYRRSDSPREQVLPPPGPRNLQYDLTLAPNHIKGKPSQPHARDSISTDSSPVLSRTLFVGGVT